MGKWRYDKTDGKRTIYTQMSKGQRQNKLPTRAKGLASSKPVGPWPGDRDNGARKESLPQGSSGQKVPSCMVYIQKKT